MASHPVNCWEAPSPTLTPPISWSTGKVLHQGTWLSGCPWHQHWWGWQVVHGLVSAEDDVQWWRLTDSPVPYQQWYHHCGAPEDALWCLDAIGTTIKAEGHSGIFGMSFSLISASSPMRVSMPYLPASAPSSPSASFPRPRRYLKSWSCNMQCSRLDLTLGPVPVHIPVPSCPM